MENIKTVCDRCGVEIKARFPKRKLVEGKRVLRLNEIFSDDPYDYTELRFDLCPKCASEFRKWMKAEP